MATNERGGMRRQGWLAALFVVLACKPAVDGTTPPPSGPDAKTAQQEPDGGRTGEPLAAGSIELEGNEVTVKAKQAFVAEACMMLCEYDEPEDCLCEVTQDLGDWLVLRVGFRAASDFGWYWYVAAATKPGHRLLAPSDEDLPPHNEEPPSSIYKHCGAVTPNEEPPRGTGLVAAEVFTMKDQEDEVLNGVPALRLECNGRDERYWIECSPAYLHCDERPSSNAPR